jgi:HEAT repeat protein
MNNLDGYIGELICGDERRAEAAIQQIQPYGEEAIDSLEPLLNSKEADHRWWAVFALAGINSPRVPILLKNQLDDPVLSVRQGAVLGLRQQPSDEAVPQLIACLKDEDPLMVHLAAAALAAVGSASVPPLLELLKNSPLPVRLEILRALRSIGDTRSIPALFEALEEDSALMEHWANEGLERMGVGMNFFKT